MPRRMRGLGITYAAGPPFHEGSATDSASRKDCARGRDNDTLSEDQLDGSRVIALNDASTCAP